MSPELAITGATGAIGGRVAARLAERGVEQRLVARDTVERLTGHPPESLDEYLTEHPESYRHIVEGGGVRVDDRREGVP